MATTSGKVKRRPAIEPPAGPRKYRVTLQKTVTLHQFSTIEVEVDGRYGDGDRNYGIQNAVKMALAEEAARGDEREWSSGKVHTSENYRIRWGLIQEIESHITETDAEPDTK